MKNIKLIIEYDGTNYHGWQTQKNAKTVQDVIERAIEGLTERKLLISSSRTDFGVHALGQVANLYQTQPFRVIDFLMPSTGYFPKIL